MMAGMLAAMTKTALDPQTGLVMQQWLSQTQWPRAPKTDESIRSNHNLILAVGLEAVVDHSPPPVLDFP